MQASFDISSSGSLQYFLHGAGTAASSPPTHTDWEAAIRRGDIEYLRSAVLRVQPEFYSEYQFCNLISCAAVRLGAEPQCSVVREIFILLHQYYADSIKGISRDDKAESQYHAIILSTVAFLSSPLDITPTTSLEIQAVFAKAIDAYVPDCPHEAYVSKESLEMVHETYNANQYLYAKWCYMTSLAMRPLVLNCSFYALIFQIGASSRSLLARLCQTETFKLFGKQRDGDLFTPLAGRYQPWHSLMRELWEENSAYCIDAIAVDGRRVAGTRLGFRKDDSDGTMKLSWLHGRALLELHQVSKEWLKKIVEVGKSGVGDFETAAGSFKHSLIQYAPFWRGSAFLALTVHHATLLAFDKPLPDAINLIDCYALSFQRDDFLQKIYIPWSRGELTEANALRLVSTRAPTVRQCVHADWHNAIARGNSEFLIKQASFAPPEFYFDKKFQHLMKIVAVFLAPNKYCKEEYIDIGQRNFLHLHYVYADSLKKLLLPLDKARLQWDAIANSMEGFLTFKRDPPLTTSRIVQRLKKIHQDAIIQSLFASVLGYYVPDCPVLTYATQKSLGKGYKGRHQNQRLYARWCYMSSLAMMSRLHTPNLDEILTFGEGACSLFVDFTAQENADQYRKSGKMVRSMYQQTQDLLTKTLELGARKDAGFESSLGALKDSLIELQPLMKGTCTVTQIITNAILLAFTSKLS